MLSMSCEPSNLLTCRSKSVIKEGSEAQRLSGEDVTYFVKLGCWHVVYHLIPQRHDLPHSVLGDVGAGVYDGLE